jgi:hypothetical protein
MQANTGWNSYGTFPYHHYVNGSGGKVYSRLFIRGWIRVYVRRRRLRCRYGMQVVNTTAGYRRWEGECTDRPFHIRRFQSKHFARARDFASRTNTTLLKYWLFDVFVALYCHVFVHACIELLDPDVALSITAWRGHVMQVDRCITIYIHIYIYINILMGYHGV